MKKIASKDLLSRRFHHTFVTPLTPIIGYCEILKNPKLGSLNKDQIEAVEEIYVNIKKLYNALIQYEETGKLDKVSL